MRLWHYKLLPYLPDAQFKGQLRELVAIMHDWRDKGKTNHLLINRVMDYPKEELVCYFALYYGQYQKRYGKSVRANVFGEFFQFTQDEYKTTGNLFEGWHDNGYLRVCMANLMEKHFYGIGASRITDDEWKRLLDGYRKITGVDYQI